MQCLTRRISVLNFSLTRRISRLTCSVKSTYDSIFSLNYKARIPSSNCWHNCVCVHSYCRFVSKQPHFTLPITLQYVLELTDVNFCRISYKQKTWWVGLISQWQNIQGRRDKCQQFLHVSWSAQNVDLFCCQTVAWGERHCHRKSFHWPTITCPYSYLHMTCLCKSLSHSPLLQPYSNQ